jgi:hypothetical protein
MIYEITHVDIDLRIILKYILNGMGCIDWIGLAVSQGKS